jgi:hypothetical protein
MHPIRTHAGETLSIGLATMALAMSSRDMAAATFYGWLDCQLTTAAVEAKFDSGATVKST